MILGTMIAAVAGMASMTATAAFEDARPYVGVDYKYVSGLDDQIGTVSEKYTNLLGVTGGIQFTDYLGTEVSWAHSVKDTSIADDLKIDYSHVTLGVTGQYPIADRLYAKALLGTVWQTYTVEMADVGKGKIEADAKFYGKAGIGYQVDSNSVLEFNYSRENELDGLGIQYKYVF